ncbi:BspA family leucine-rich repeat surface protein [uncultured Brachyspira sp.]|uniref:BspA family leucine-rich repeat surface protein n=1 Tax=uncultured Brachyspira sp. TaxID=221953 RepID=UPI00262F8181|nr:BspA family leucine-rich repeat surface protein [uncultured Brachyspira sp.]
MSKYKPKTNDELKKLIDDENISLADIDTSLITDMSFLFKESKRKNFDGIENWNTSNVHDMIGMFKDAHYFNNDLNNWDTSNLKKISYMFFNASAFNKYPDKWNLDNIKEAYDVFNDNIDIKKLPLNLRINLYYEDFDKIKDIDIKDIYKTIITSKNRKIIAFRTKLEKEYYDELKNLIEHREKIESENEVKFQTIEEVYDYVDNHYEESFNRNLKFVQYDDDIFSKDKSETIDIKIIKFIYGSYLKVKDNVMRLKTIDNIIDLIDMESFRNAAYKIFENDRSKVASRIIVGIYGKGSIIKNYAKSIQGKEFYPRSYYVYILALNDGKYALSLIDEMAKKSKIESVRNASNSALDVIADRMKINRDELSGLLIPDFGLNRNGERIVNIENKEYKISVNSKMSVDIIENNKILKTIPKTFSKELKSEINFMKKEIKNVVKREKEKILMLLMNGRKLSYEFWKKIYIDNSFLSQYSINLFWNLYDEKENFIDIFRYLGDGSFINTNDDYIKLNENNLISLCSPVEMSNELIEKCIKQLSDYEAAQPIKQLQIINNLENEFDKYNSINTTVSNIKNFTSQFAFKEISEYYEEVNGYEYFDNYSGLSLYIESPFDRNSNYNDEIDIKISIQGTNENNKHLFDRFMYGSILILENLIK